MREIRANTILNKEKFKDDLKELYVAPVAPLPPYYVTHVMLVMLYKGLKEV